MRDSTHKIFRRPTLRAIKNSTFEPLGPSQVLATAKTCRTYRFRLEPLTVDTESTQSQQAIGFKNGVQQRSVHGNYYGSGIMQIDVPMS